MLMKQNVNNDVTKDSPINLGKSRRIWLLCHECQESSPSRARLCLRTVWRKMIARRSTHDHAVRNFTNCADRAHNSLTVLNTRGSSHTANLHSFYSFMSAQREMKEYWYGYAVHHRSELASSSRFSSGISKARYESWDDLSNVVPMLELALVLFTTAFGK